jgi:hypothetical protein
MAFTPEQLAVADRFVQLRIHQANGSAYEDLFVEVMTLRYADFRPVKPQGAVGDRKNDGYREKAGIYYQVYAPEKPDDKVLAAVRKIGEDFEGLMAFWNTLCPILGFNFVFNDKFKGAYPEIEATLLQLKKTHNLADCRCFLAKDLMEEISKLDDRSLLKITGIIPSPEMIESLDFGVFTGVLRYVTDNSRPLNHNALLTVPDFAEKIRLNDISDPVAGLLRTANIQSGAVEKFFASDGAFSKPLVRNKLAQIYSEIRATMVGENSVANSGDLIFFALLAAITPQPTAKSSQDAAMVLLAYFFESCDIYEDPAIQAALNL